MLTGLLLLALLPRLAFVLLVPYHGPGGDEAGYDHLAWSLAQGKGFVDESGNPTSFYFPVYPHFVAAIYKLFGHAYLPVFLAQALLSAALCVMVFFFAKQLSGSMTTAYFAFMFSTFYPSFILFTQELLGDLLLTVLFFMFLICLYRSMLKSRLPYAAAGGFLFGVCSLIRGECLLFLVILLIYHLSTKKTCKLSFRSGALFLTMLLLTLAPWSVRNTLALKTFVPFSTRGGITLYNSYFLAEQGFSFNQVKNAGKQYYTLRTEVEKDRYLMKKTLHYMVRYPLKVAALIPVKIGYLFYPFDGQWYAVSLLSKYNVMFGIVFSFAAAGFFMLLRQENKTTGFLLLLPVLSAMLTASIFYGKPRFRLILEPYLILSCSFCLAQQFRKQHAPGTFFKKTSPVLLVNVFLFLFAGPITAVLRQIINTFIKMYPQG